MCRSNKTCLKCFKHFPIRVQKNNVTSITCPHLTLPSHLILIFFVTRFFLSSSIQVLNMPCFSSRKFSLLFSPLCWHFFYTSFLYCFSLRWKENKYEDEPSAKAFFENFLFFFNKKKLHTRKLLPFFRVPISWLALANIFIHFLEKFRPIQSWKIEEK